MPMPPPPGLRRPETKNSFELWYVSDARWTALLEDATSGDKARMRAGTQNLRKLEAAGRIMETDDGVDAEQRCSFCTSHDLLCRVVKGEAMACAACRRGGKAGCNAREFIDHKALAREAAAANPASADEIAKLRERIAEMQDLPESAEMQSKQLMQMANQQEKGQHEREEIISAQREKLAEHEKTLMRQDTKLRRHDEMLRAQDERLRQQDLLLQEQSQEIKNLALDMEAVFKRLWPRNER